MIKAIIYTSNTGFTRKYAEMLQSETGIKAYNFEEAKQKVHKNEEIIYMGWIMAGTIKNYKKIKIMYNNIIAICAVGMGRPKENQYDYLKEKNNINGVNLFYLQGGFDKKKLKGIYKFMINSIEKILRPKLEAKTNKTDEEIEMLEMINKGKNCVKKENLDGIIKFLKVNSN